MGANIEAHKNNIIIHGKSDLKLKGANIIAKDLRGAASLLIAGILADKNSTTVINNMHFIHRGYDSIVEKMKMCGIHIKERVHI